MIQILVFCRTAASAAWKEQGTVALKGSHRKHVQCCMCTIAADFSVGFRPQNAHHTASHKTAWKIEVKTLTVQQFAGILRLSQVK